MQWTGPSTAKGKVGTPAPVSSQTTAELIAMECCETHDSSHESLGRRALLAK